MYMPQSAIYLNLSILQVEIGVEIRQNACKYLEQHHQSIVQIKCVKL